MDIKKIVKQFLPKAEIVSAEPFGNGHINDTYRILIKNSDTEYILQKINHRIFKNIEMLQKNITVVTTKIREKLEERKTEDIDRKVLTFLPATDGKTYYFDEENYWRICILIKDSVSREEVTPELSYQAGQAFGDFQKILSELPEGAIEETIPHFHNMEFRLKEFYEALKNNKAGRAASVKELTQEIKKRAEAMCIQEQLNREGKLKKRTNHCDTKVNNILFDKEGQVLCVIDLDTVMPGYVLSDIGDFIRTAVNTGAEDEQDLSKIDVNMEIFKAYTKGYMEEAKDFLTPIEIKLLPYGGRLLTYMQTVRFLTDYLNGDTYYKIQYPEHNLQRTKAQFRFLQKLEEHQVEMDKFMEQWL